MARNEANDFEGIARQYWSAWGDAMRASAPQQASQPGAQAWQDAMNAWASSAGGAASPFGNVLDHFKTQHGQWFAQMQQVAARFAGRDHSAADVAQAWKQALGPAGANPFPELFSSMRGPGLEGLEQWNEAAAPWLQGMRGEAASMLGMPAFGVTREHQERLQAIARSQLRWQDALAAYNALMAKSSQEAYARFESKLAEREEPGRQLGSARALFDLWIDAAEEAYAETALSLEYRQAYGDMVNAQMRLRSDVQAIAEQAAGVLGLPGRVELDSAHRKIAELERQLRRMQRMAEDAANAASAGNPPASGNERARNSTRRKAGPATEAPVKSARKATKKAPKNASKRAASKATKDTAPRATKKAARKAAKPPVRKPATRKR